MPARSTQMSFAQLISTTSLITGLTALLSIPAVASAQSADDSREKSEKVTEILAALQAAPGKRIADVGAGEGFYSLRIARAVGPTGRVTAVDVSKNTLKYFGHVSRRTTSRMSTSSWVPFMIHACPNVPSMQY